jgi:hypothetical protein
MCYFCNACRGKTPTAACEANREMPTLFFNQIILDSEFMSNNKLSNPIVLDQYGDFELNWSYHMAGTDTGNPFCVGTTKTYWLLEDGFSVFNTCLSLPTYKRGVRWVQLMKMRESCELEKSDQVLTRFFYEIL